MDKENIQLEHARQLNNLKNYYENIIAKIPGHVYWKNTEGIFLGCNDQQAKTLGLSSRHEVVGKNTFDMVWQGQSLEERKQQAAIIDATDHEIITMGKTVVIEEPLVKPDGTTAVYLSNKTPLYDENNKIIGILGISFDITAQKEAEKLRHEKEEAEKRSEYLRAAAGSIAHELRTPLASIRLAVQAIANFLPKLLSAYKMARDAKLQVPEFRAGHLEALESRVASIVQQVNFSNTFIDLVLGNLKEEKDLTTESYTQHSMNTIVNNCLANYPFSGNENSLIHWTPQVDFTIWGDELLMMNVLNNLIKNSLYYIKAANKGDIHIWLEQKDDVNLLYFKDSAKGAPPEIVEHLFESFFSRRQGGTGLGLAFCKKIMVSIGGDIIASSLENEYMQFVLTFPKR